MAGSNKLPPNPQMIKIVIIGAGLGGLTAAICFSRRGHDVVLLERQSGLNPAGGGINIRPGASGILGQWGLEEDLRSISDQTPTVLIRSMETGNIVTRRITMEDVQDSNWGTTREELIKMLFQKVSNMGIDVRFNTTVKDVHDDQNQTYASVELEDGSKINADIILAADGIRSRVREKALADLNLGEKQEPIVKAMTMYGMRLPRADLEAKLGKSCLTDQVNINMWIGKGGFVVTRSSSKSEFVGLLFAMDLDTDQKGLWDENGDINIVREFFAGSCKELTTALSMSDRCDRWKLSEMPHLPRWTSRAGRVVLLGDSAHAMHPQAAQGFSQIVEDIGMLDYLLSEEASTRSIPQITQIWEAIRKPRVEKIKDFAKWNTSVFSRGNNAKKSSKRPQEKTSDTINLSQVKGDMNGKFSSPEFRKWTLEYDVAGEASKYLRQTQSKL